MTECIYVEWLRWINGSIIKTIANAGLERTNATATDPAEISAENQLLYTNAARVSLVPLFAGISLTVYRAYAKRIKEGGPDHGFQLVLMLVVQVAVIRHYFVFLPEGTTHNYHGQSWILYDENDDEPR